MAYRVCFIRVPKYKNVTLDQIELINTYLKWKGKCEKNTKYACDTFKQWCGHTEDELPEKEIIDHYKKYYLSEHRQADESLPDYHYDGVIEFLAKISKASQIFYWIVKNKAGKTKIETLEEYHNLSDYNFELTKQDLEDLIIACINVRKFGISFEDEKYIVNEEIAKALLPIMEINNEMLFPYAYCTPYASQINNTIKWVNEIVSTTDFEQYTVYCLYM